MSTNVTSGNFPGEGNQAGSIQNNSVVKTVTKETMTKVPTKPMTHEQAKANAKVTGTTIAPIGGGLKTTSMD